MEKQDIRALDLEQLTSWFIAHGEKSFRAKQVFEWIWKKSVTDFSKMTNLSKDLRALLETNFQFFPVSIAEEQISNDGTIKVAFQLAEGHVVEGVLIPTEKRMTACISSQVGCSLSCAFCATGRLKRMKNLSAGEIYDQVVLINNIALAKYKKPISNIVYMGMGEPLMNLKGLLESVDKITSPNGLGMSPKRITVSTAGISRAIMRLADEDVKFNLALSLHAATDEKRDSIMPINQSNTLDSLAESMIYFRKKTQKTITYEYIIFKDFNDSIADARELMKFCQRVPAKINIIEYNPIDGGEFEKSPIERVDEFAHYLEQHDIQVNIRRSRGKDIDAACGQLANKNDAA